MPENEPTSYRDIFFFDPTDATGRDFDYNEILDELFDEKINNETIEPERIFDELKNYIENFDPTSDGKNFFEEIGFSSREILNVPYDSSS